MHVRSERRYNKPAPGVVVENVIERVFHDRLAHGIAFNLYVGGIRHHKKNTLFTEFCDTRKVRGFAVHGGIVYFEVARVEHYARGRGYGERDRPRDRVVYVYEFHRKTAEFNHAARLYTVERRALYPLLSEFVLNKRKREFCPEHGHVEFF